MYQAAVGAYTILSYVTYVLAVQLLFGLLLEFTFYEFIIIISFMRTHFSSVGFQPLPPQLHQIFTRPCLVFSLCVEFVCAFSLLHLFYGNQRDKNNKISLLQPKCNTKYRRFFLLYIDALVLLLRVK